MEACGAAGEPSFSEITAKALRLCADQYQERSSAVAPHPDLSQEGLCADEKLLEIWGARPQARSSSSCINGRSKITTIEGFINLLRVPRRYKFYKSIWWSTLATRRSVHDLKRVAAFQANSPKLRRQED